MTYSLHLLKKLHDKMSFINQYNIFNEEYSIYRTIIIVDNTGTQDALYRDFINNGYDIYKTSTGKKYADDDFNIFLNRNMRIYLMTIHDYLEYSKDLLKLITREHNMIITNQLDRSNINLILASFDTIRKTLNITDDYLVWVN